MTKYYQYLITGQQNNFHVPKINIIVKFVLLIYTLKFMYLFKKVGGNTCLNYIEAIKPIKKYRFLGPMSEYLFARKVTSFVQYWINTMHKQALCLERAVVICSALRLVGLPAQLVIGRRSTMMSVLDFEFHAWVELQGIPVNEKLSYKKLCMETYRTHQEQGIGDIDAV